jgi:hypothetical protein
MPEINFVILSAAKKPLGHGHSKTHWILRSAQNDKRVLCAFLRVHSRLKNQLVRQANCRAVGIAAALPGSQAAFTPP